LTDKLNKNHTAFTRPISLRGSSYNQEYTPGSILVEIGSCGNTLEEAKNAGVIFAEEVSKLILEGW
jgi:stage II sporulation protein P